MDFIDTTKYLLFRKIDKKSTSITPWGTYAHIFIHFILNNVGETFQRSKDHAFNDLIGNFMED
jgi:hypothetical protein